jgi:hypothetical protein
MSSKTALAAMLLTTVGAPRRAEAFEDDVRGSAEHAGR